uniref:Secreted protein n=1 Tax=Syphacia muris TaxID=451379 RepID=A0A0N5ACF8_9BILA
MVLFTECSIPVASLPIFSTHTERRTEQLRCQRGAVMRWRRTRTEPDQGKREYVTQPIHHNQRLLYLMLKQLVCLYPTAVYSICVT